MEEQELGKADFNAKVWLENQLQAKQNSGQSLELQLTELLFNAKMIQAQSEEQVIHAQEALQQKQENLFEKSEQAISEFVSIKDFLDDKLQGENIAQFQNVNEELFVSINEMTSFKGKLQVQMDILEGILQMDYHIETIQELIKQQDLEKLVQKLDNISDTLAILFQLPKINPRYGQAEKVLSLILLFAEEYSLQKFTEERGIIIPVELFQLYQVLKRMNQDSLFVNLYATARTQEDNLKINIKKNKQTSALDQNNQNNNNNVQNRSNYNNNIILELAPYIDNVQEMIQKEGQYLFYTKSNKNNQDNSKNNNNNYSLIINNEEDHQDYNSVLSKMLGLYIQKTLNILVKDFLNVGYFENNSCESIFEFHQVYLAFLNFVSTLGSSDKSWLLDEHLKDLQNQIFQPYLKFVVRQSENEQNYIASYFQKENKTHANLTQDLLLEEKLQEYNFLKLLNVIQSSFDRINNITFGIELEDWKIELEKNITDNLSKLQRIVVEIKNKPNSNLLDPNYDQIFGVQQQKQQQQQQQQQQNQNQKFDFTIKNGIKLKKHTGLLQALLNKFQELLYFQKELFHISKYIKEMIFVNSATNQKSQHQQKEKSTSDDINNNSSILKNNETVQDISLQVQQFILNKNQEKLKQRQILMINLKNDEIFFDQTYKEVRQTLDTLKQFILQLFLSDSYNNFSEIFEKYKSVKPKKQSQQKKTENENDENNDDEDYDDDDDDNDDDDEDDENMKDTEDHDFIASVCQNFFMHVQMLEEIKISLSQSSNLNSYLKDKNDNNQYSHQQQQLSYSPMKNNNNQQQQFQKNKQQGDDLDIQKVLQQCYTRDLKSNPFLKHKLADFEDQDVYDFVKYWSFFYTFYLAKLYLIFHQQIEKNIKHIWENMNLIQRNIKYIEYFLNVFNSFAETCSSIASLEQILSDLKNKLEIQETIIQKKSQKNINKKPKKQNIAII